MTGKPSKDELYQMYVTEGMTMEQIAEVCDARRWTVSKWLKYHGIQTRCIETIQARMPKKDELERKYINEGMTQREIAKYYGVSHGAIFELIHEHDDIPLKSRSGETHYNWKGGITSEKVKKHNDFLKSPEYHGWRDIIFKRDDYTCQQCGVSGVLVHAHHILPYRDYPELVLDPDNGITLCKSCHEQTYGHEYDYIEKYQDITMPYVDIDYNLIESSAILDISCQ